MDGLQHMRNTYFLSSSALHFKKHDCNKIALKLTNRQTQFSSGLVLSMNAIERPLLLDALTFTDNNVIRPSWCANDAACCPHGNQRS